MFTKIFQSIYDGSLRKDWKALVTFQQMLVLADREGYVDMTPDAITSRTTIPREIIDHGLRELSEPDKESRSQEFDGRRLVLINPVRSWGWIIVNFRDYRDIVSQDDLRAYWRGQKKSKKPKEEPGPEPEYKPVRNPEPTLDEVKLVFSKAGGNVEEAEKFFNFYSSKGWMVGKTKMRSMPHAVAGWIGRAKEGTYGNKNSGKPNPRLDGITRGPTDYAAAYKRRSAQSMGGQVAQAGTEKPVNSPA